MLTEVIHVELTLVVREGARPERESMSSDLRATEGRFWTLRRRRRWWAAVDNTSCAECPAPCVGPLLGAQPHRSLALGDSW